jgi:predicted transcriptional regulator
MTADTLTPQGYKKLSILVDPRVDEALDELKRQDECTKLAVIRRALRHYVNERIPGFDSTEASQ